MQDSYSPRASFAVGLRAVAGVIGVDGDIGLNDSN
jgi:hypothetical protein